MNGFEGRQVGSYRFVRRLGQGGFSEVYLAEDELNHNQWAVKLPLNKDPNFRERFIREMQTLILLSHPNIVQVREGGEQGRLLYLVMPYYEKGTLEGII